MQQLAMAGGRFAVALNALEEPGAAGAEEIEFEVASHPSLPLRPLAKVASGGELSRISLAIQLVAAKESPVGTLVFDEVDTGIGGAVAETIGRSLRKLGKERQVLCVTHLPQVAASGNEQWTRDALGREGESGEARPRARGSPSWRACWAGRRPPRASTRRSCWTQANSGSGPNSCCTYVQTNSALTRISRAVGQFFLVQSAYSASEWPCSLKPRWRATSVWRFSISAS